MSDSTLTAMTPPASITVGQTTNTIAGVPYRVDTDGLVYVKTTDVAEMTALGFSTASTATVAVDDPGQPLVLDQGW